MRIFKYKGKLVEETSRASNVVFFKYLKEEDKETCPHCHKPLEISQDIVEDCLNWKGDVEAVETIK